MEEQYFSFIHLQEPRMSWKYNPDNFITEPTLIKYRNSTICLVCNTGILTKLQFHRHQLSTKHHFRLIALKVKQRNSSKKRVAYISYIRYLSNYEKITEESEMTVPLKIMLRERIIFIMDDIRSILTDQGIVDKKMFEMEVVNYSLKMYCKICAKSVLTHMVVKHLSSSKHICRLNNIKEDASKKASSTGVNWRVNIFQNTSLRVCDEVIFELVFETTNDYVSCFDCFSKVGLLELESECDNYNEICQSINESITEATSIRLITGHWYTLIDRVDSKPSFRIQSTEFKQMYPKVMYPVNCTTCEATVELTRIHEYEHTLNLRFFTNLCFRNGYSVEEKKADVWEILVPEAEPEPREDEFIPIDNSEEYVCDICIEAFPLINDDHDYSYQKHQQSDEHLQNLKSCCNVDELQDDVFICPICDDCVKLDSDYDIVQIYSKHSESDLHTTALNIFSEILSL